MCGIAGIVIKTGQLDPMCFINSMLSVAIHRGPDDEGVFSDKNLALGHRRLSIIDLSENAGQPMHYSKRYVIVYNGEVYNYIELKAELKNQGYAFSTESDTEVILAAYNCWGEDCVKRFNGMWAFAIYDTEKQILFCSRDRFGIKPFYYYLDDQIFCFASEIKQILTCKSKVVANRDVLLNYLLTGLEEYNDQTFFTDISKLSPGSNLIYDLKQNKIESYRYYHLNPATLNNDDEVYLTNTFRDLLTDSVRLRLRSDVRVGTCLSGGLDSSSVATLATGLYREVQDEYRLTGFHGKSTEKASDESQYALRVAIHAGLKVHMIEKHIIDFQQALIKVIQAQEEPFGSPSVIMQYFVLQRAHEEGVKVMLDGQGGDELLLGYERYFVSWLYQQKGLGKLLNFSSAVQNSKLKPLTLFQYYFYFTNFNLRFNRIKNRFSFIKPGVIKSFDCSLLKDHTNDFKHFETLQEKEITRYQLPHLLKYEDKNSMAHSIEARIPFLDYRLVELSLALPMALKIKDGWSKYILRKAIEPYLPDAVTWRKNKFGFLAPVSTWLSDRPAIEKEIFSSELLSSLIAKKTLPFEDRGVIWRLFNIALWEKTFGVTLDVENSPKIYSAVSR